MNEELNEYATADETATENKVIEPVDNVIQIDFGDTSQPTEMKNLVKSLDQEVTEEMLESLLGKIVYVPQNEHLTLDPSEEEFKTVNVWFAGVVAGYEKAIIKFDLAQNTFMDEPTVRYSLFLTDGVSYILSKTKCEIVELTRDEFMNMVAEHQERQLKKQAKQDILKNILLPGRDFNV
jgi:hypothetical protein